MATTDKDQKTLSVKGSDFLCDLVCKPCHLDDIVKPAFGYCTDCDEHLCSMCFANHKKPRPLRHHKLLDSSSMPTTQTLDDTDTTVDEGPSDSLTTPCVIHSQKNIEFYCNDHRTTLCSVCVTLNHTISCKVDHITDVSILNSDMLREIPARAQEIVIKCDSVKNKISQDTQQTIDSLKKSLSDLKKYSSHINRILDTQEQEMTNKITDLTEERDRKLKTIATQCQAMKTDTNLKNDRLNKMNKSKQPNQIFIALQQTTTILDEYEDRLQSIEIQHRLDKYQFIPSTAIQQILKAENALGKILNIKPDAISVKTVEDMHDCRITGMTEIYPEKLVLADTTNKSIKLVDTYRKAVASTLKLENKPFDLTKISTTEVAVTVPGGYCIQFVTVSNNLEKSRKINTNGQCYGICYHQDKLIVTYRSSGKLEILDMKGKVIRSITTDRSSKPTLPDPLYVHVTNANLFVTDMRNSTITKLSWDLEIISRYDQVKEPTGLTLIEDRSSLVVCSGSRHCLYELDNDNMNSKVILQDVKCPYAVCVNHQNNKLFISRYSLNETWGNYKFSRHSVKKLDNNILVYEI